MGHYDAALMSGVMKLEKREHILDTGEKVWYEYDRDSDMLEIIFRPAKASCAIELTESIILRFDWAANEPLSLGFISISSLLQSNQYGEVHFQLLSDEWPEDAQGKIWKMLRQSPLTEFLTLSSFMPAHTHQTIPVAAIKPSDLLTRAA